MALNEIAIEAVAKTLRNCATDSRISLGTVRAGILNFVADGYWPKFYAMAQVREYARFEDFAAQWMQFPLPDLIKVFVDDAEVRAVLRKVVGPAEFDAIERGVRDKAKAVKAVELPPTAATPGAPKGNKNADKNNANNISIDSSHRCGTARAYTLRRLARDRPDLLERVQAGELSANAAAIEAGFRKKPAPLEQVTKLLDKLGPDELRQVAELCKAKLI